MKYLIKNAFGNPCNVFKKTVSNSYAEWFIMFKFKD